MRTYVPKAQGIVRRWHVIDANGKPLGRVAAQVAILLRGKHKPIFAPHVDCGDHVVVVNCAKAVLTGKKMEHKCRYRHTGYVGHLKTIHYKDLFEKRPELALDLAVKGMLPHNSQGRKQALRMHLFAGPEHNNQAQQPQLWEIDKEVV